MLRHYRPVHGLTTLTVCVFALLLLAPTAASASDLAPTSRKQLEALGYLRGYEPAPQRTGVTRHDAGAQPGFNLYVAGHAPEANLIDMSGRVAYSWSLPYQSACPAKHDESNWYQRFWRHVHLLPDGGLLAIFENQGLIRIDVDSNLVWARCESYHHDLAVDDRGRIWALRSDLRLHQTLDARHRVLDDAIEVLDADGKSQDRISILEAFERSPFAPQLSRIDRRRLKKNGDVFHTNAIRILKGSARNHPLFRAGNLLVSVRELDAVAVIDPRARKVVWSLAAMWRRQHDPVLLDCGALLLFDNLGRGGRSRIVEIDPITQELLWSFPHADDVDLYSDCCGKVQRLSNGNTLITETGRGRAIEVTREGRVVWEFVNPHRVDEGGEPRIASLFELLRLEGRRLPWLRDSRLPDPPPQPSKDRRAPASRHGDSSPPPG
jgi:hypothetical protein